MKSFVKNIFSKQKNKEDIEVQKVDIEEVVPASDIWEKLRYHRIMTRRFWLIAIGVIGLLLVSFLCYAFLHTGISFTTISETERADISGTEYVEFGKGIIKYSPDGVSSLTNKGEVNWSNTFSMQSPMVDVREATLAVAEKNGTQVYVFNENGLLGQFQTVLPIEKVRVSEQGVVAVVLQDEDVTWVNLYDAAGHELVTHRTTLTESGYPLDVALSPEGLKIAISYLCVTQGIMNTKICFYNFDAVGQAEQDNLVSSQTYDNVVAPRVFFADSDTAIVIRNDGFSIFEGRQVPELAKEEAFVEEIVSVFSDDEYFGLVFPSDNNEHKYKMQVYTTAGKRVVERYFDLMYNEIKLVNSKIILYNESAFEVYGTNGRLKFTGNYPKPISDVISLKGFGKYLVLTRESTDMIRVK